MGNVRVNVGMDRGSVKRGFKSAPDPYGVCYILKENPYLSIGSVIAQNAFSPVTVIII